VTRDPAALAEARRVARGLDLLSRATGVEGAISRAVGRMPPGEPAVKDGAPSPLGGGLWYRGDPSRDSLSGVVLGWDLLARYVDDPEVHDLAVRNLAAIARRLFEGGMQLRDVDGHVTTFGKLEPRVKATLGLVTVGEHAAIGLAAIAAGMKWSGARDLYDAWHHLTKADWDDTLDDQHTWLAALHNEASNWNMVHLGLLVVALETTGKPQRNAAAGLRSLRRATRGWQNGSFLACSLLAGCLVDRDDMVEELRGTLLAMPAAEGPWYGTRTVETRGITPIEQRPVNVWMWKQNPHRMEVDLEGAVPDPQWTFTRADFLFAYWLARAAGELTPDVEPSATVVPPSPPPPPSPAPLPNR